MGSEHIRGRGGGSERAEKEKTHGQLPFPSRLIALLWTRRLPERSPSNRLGAEEVPLRGRMAVGHRMPWRWRLC